MALIKSQLEYAQLHNLAADPTPVSMGLLYFHTANLVTRLYNGTAWKTLVDTDTSQVLTGKDIDGGTASNTNRITLPKDTTTNISALARKAGTIVFDTDLLTPKYDDGFSLYEFATLGTLQIFTNKDIDGGTAANTRRITLPKDTTTNLNALTRKQGTVVYDTTLGLPKYDDGTNLKAFVGIDATQVLTNKDIDGGTAANTRRITLPKDTTTNLNALARKQGTIVYDTDLDFVKYDTGGSLKTLVTLDAVQTLTNKDIDGGNANNSNRITLSKATTTTLNNLTRKQATLFYDTTLGIPKYDDGTNLKAFVGIDATQVLTNKDIDGGTAANTRRITLPKDTTTNIDALARKQGTIVYDTTLGLPKYDDGTNLKAFVGIDATQVLTNKDIDGGTAANTRRITLPKDTTTNLNALARKQGTIVYDTTLGLPKYDDGTNLIPIGSFSTPNFALNPDAELNVTNVTSPDYTITQATGLDTLGGSASFLITGIFSSSYVDFTLRSPTYYSGSKIAIATCKIQFSGMSAGQVWRVGLRNNFNTWLDYVEITADGNYIVKLQSTKGFNNGSTYTFRVASLYGSTPSGSIKVDDILVDLASPNADVSEDSYNTDAYGSSRNPNDKLVSILTRYQFLNKNSLVYPGTLPTPTTVAGSWGGALAPTVNRIYYAPCLNSDSYGWLYQDCESGQLVEYAPGVSATSLAYSGAVYSPTQNRIYFVPYSQATQTNWHYVNCTTGGVVAYAHGATVSDGGYVGGVYHPMLNRIYLVPNTQATQSTWHYIDCNTGNIVGYAHGATAVIEAYRGGVFEPINNRIYFVPYGQSNQTNWHYVNDSGSVVSYAHGQSLPQYAYQGGAYSPTLKRIVFAPWTPQASLHYVDCVNSSIGAYGNPYTGNNYRFNGAVYHPITDRIYFAPVRSAASVWLYVDCRDSSNTVLSYAPGVNNMAGDEAYAGGVYSPTTNKIYFVPFVQADQTTTHYLGCSGSSQGLSPGFCSVPGLVTGG